MSPVRISTARRIAVVFSCLLLGLAGFLAMRALGSAPTVSQAQAVAAAQLSDAHAWSTNVFEALLPLIALAVLLGAALAWPDAGKRSNPQELPMRVRPDQQTPSRQTNAPASPTRSRAIYEAPARRQATASRHGSAAPEE